MHLSYSEATGYYAAGGGTNESSVCGLDADNAIILNCKDTGTFKDIYDRNVGKY